MLTKRSARHRRWQPTVDVDRCLQAVPTTVAGRANWYRELLTRRDALVRPMADKPAR